jgi:hypothetical protein
MAAVGKLAAFCNLPGWHLTVRFGPNLHLLILLILLLLLPSPATHPPAFQAAGVGSALQPGTTWTILAPTNDAFASRLQASLGITPQQLLEPANKDTLVKVGCPLWQLGTVTRLSAARTLC